MIDQKQYHSNTLKQSEKHSSPSPSPNQQLADENELQLIKAAVNHDLKAVDHLITLQLQDKLALIKSVCEYIIRSGGKRIRPLLVILAARAFNYSGSEHIQLAAIAEFLHTATLLHDDVIDHSTLRRHHETANQVWDNETSILIGDFLHALSFRMIVDLGNTAAMKTLSEATIDIVTGEVMQLKHRQSPDTSEERYMAVIYRKTARLFAAAAELGGIVSQCHLTQIQLLSEYGAHLGMAYQLVDDILDYTAPAQVMGKRLGNDLSEGKATLPIIYAMRYGTPNETQLIQHALSQGDYQSLEAITGIIQSTQAIQRAQETVQFYIKQAQHRLEQLEDSGGDCTLLKRLTIFIGKRVY